MLSTRDTKIVAASGPGNYCIANRFERTEQSDRAGDAQKRDEITRRNANMEWQKRRVVSTNFIVFMGQSN